MTIGAATVICFCVIRSVAERQDRQSGPLASGGRHSGTLAAFTRTATAEFPEETVAALEQLFGKGED